VPRLKDELAKDPDDPIKKYRVVFAEGKGLSWEVDKTFNAQQEEVAHGGRGRIQNERQRWFMRARQPLNHALQRTTAAAGFSCILHPSSPVAAQLGGVMSLCCRLGRRWRVTQTVRDESV